MTKAATAVKTDTKGAEVKPEIQATAAQVKKIAELTTVSARIRYLDAEGYTRSQIPKLITNAKGGKLRYQHVRNVLEAKAPKNPS